MNYKEYHNELIKSIGDSLGIPSRLLGVEKTDWRKITFADYYGLIDPYKHFNSQFGLGYTSTSGGNEMDECRVGAGRYEMKGGGIAILKREDSDGNWHGTYNDGWKAKWNSFGFCLSCDGDRGDLVRPLGDSCKECGQELPKALVINGAGRYLLRNGEEIRINNFRGASDSVHGPWYGDHRGRGWQWHTDGTFTNNRGRKADFDVVERLGDLPETKPIPIIETGRYRLRDGLTAVITHEVKGETEPWRGTIDKYGDNCWRWKGDGTVWHVRTGDRLKQYDVMERLGDVLDAPVTPGQYMTVRGNVVSVMEVKTKLPWRGEFLAKGVERHGYHNGTWTLAGVNGIDPKENLVERIGDLPAEAPRMADESELFGWARWYAENHDGQYWQYENEPKAGPWVFYNDPEEGRRRQIKSRHSPKSIAGMPFDKTLREVGAK